jgi:beta-galactosidase
VSGAQQQGWVWNGYSRGAKAVIFWCWRDEVFAAESSGFGIIGDDGLADDRLAHMRRTGDVLKKHADLLDGYQPDQAKVGLLFTPETPMIDWSINGEAIEMSSAVRNYCRALERLSIPYEVLEAGHLDRLDQVGLLIMPEPVVIEPQVERRLLDYVTVGGKLLVEAYAQAWDADGVFHYTGKGRSLMSTLDLAERCRKHPGQADGQSAKWGVAIPTRWAVTPWLFEQGDILGHDADGDALLVKVPYGAGQVYALGTWAAFGSEADPALVPFLAALLQDAGVMPDIRVEPADGEGRLVWRTGRSGDKRLFFLINLELQQARTVSVTMPEGYGVSGEWQDLISGQAVPVALQGHELCFKVQLEGGQVAVLVSR